jgi:hypothetical protein
MVTDVSKYSANVIAKMRKAARKIAINESFPLLFDANQKAIQAVMEVRPLPDLPAKTGL